MVGPYKSASLYYIAVCDPSLGDHEASIQWVQSEIVDGQKRIQYIPESTQLGGRDLPLEPSDDLLDWILVHMLPGRAAAYILVSTTLIVLCIVHWQFLQLPDSTYSVRYLTDKLELYDTLRKLGHSTERTGGRINSVESYIRFKVTSFETSSIEAVVLASGLDTFIRAGNSGAWVVDGTGPLFGMLWGGLTGREGTFVTPINAISDDITQQTGYSV